MSWCPWLCTFFRDLLPPVRVNGWVPDVGGEQGFVELVLPPAFFAFGEGKAGGDGLGDEAEALLVGDVFPEGLGGVRGFWAVSQRSEAARLMVPPQLMRMPDLTRLPEPVRRVKSSGARLASASVRLAALLTI